MWDSISKSILKNRLRTNHWWIQRFCMEIQIFLIFHNVPLNMSAYCLLWISERFCIRIRIFLIFQYVPLNMSANYFLWFWERFCIKNANLDDLIFDECSKIYEYNVLFSTVLELQIREIQLHIFIAEIFISW